jgi:hypothetical protein
MNMTNKNKSRFLPAILFLAVIVLLAVVLTLRFLSQSKVVQPLQTSAKDKEIAALVATMDKNRDVDSQEHKEAYKQFCILTARPTSERDQAVVNIREYLARPDANVDFVCSRFESSDYNKPVTEAYNAAQFGFWIDPKTNYITQVDQPVSNTSTWGRNADGSTWFTPEVPYDYTNRYTQAQVQKVAYDFIVNHPKVFGVDLANWELDPSRVGMKDGGGTQVNYFIGWKNKNKSLTKEHEVCGDVDQKRAGAYKNAEGVWCIKQTSTNYQSVDVTITSGGQIIRYSNNINDLAKL